MLPLTRSPCGTLSPNPQLGMLNKATADKPEATPGYLYDEVRRTDSTPPSLASLRHLTPRTHTASTGADLQDDL